MNRWGTSPTFALLVAVALVAMATSLTIPGLAAPGDTTRISVASDGTQGNLPTGQVMSMSVDGRFVAFESAASNLVAGDSNENWDIFLRDRTTGTTERVNVASDGTQASGSTFDPAISADGRFVAFDSFSSNLVPGDSNGYSDVFVRDRLMGTTERVSVASDGAQANHQSFRPSLTADGRFVAFGSNAANLVPGDTNGAADVFVRDRVAGTTERISVSSDGTWGNGDSGRFGSRLSISADGRLVAFASLATNLVPGDTNGAEEVSVRDRLAGTTQRVSVASTGAQGNGTSGEASISGDGRFVAFSTLTRSVVPAKRSCTNTSSQLK